MQQLPGAKLIAQSEKSKKTFITEKQKMQFNRMLAALKTIHKDYQTPDQLNKNGEKQYGLPADEVIEMAYENIQSLAKAACKNVLPLK